MALLEEGRVGIKRLGRDAGSKVVVTKVVDQNFVMVMSSIRPHERRANIKHIEFIAEVVDAKNKAQVAKVLEIEEAKVGIAPKTKPAAAAKPAAKPEKKAKK